MAAIHSPYPGLLTLTTSIREAKVGNGCLPPMLHACMLLLHMVAYILSALTCLNLPAPRLSHVTICCPHCLCSMKGVEAILDGFSTFISAEIEGWAPFTQAWSDAGWVLSCAAVGPSARFCRSAGSCVDQALQLPMLACGLHGLTPPSTQCCKQLHGRWDY